MSIRASSRTASIFSVSVHHIRGNIAAVELHALYNLRIGLSGLGLLNGDNAVGGDLLHSLGDQVADAHPQPEEIAPTRAMSPRAVDGLGILLRSLQQQPRLPWRCRFVITIGFAPAATFFRPSRTNACASSGSGGGAVACDVVGLGGNFLHQLCAHVLERVFELDLLGDGHAVVGDERTRRTSYRAQRCGPSGRW